MKTLRRIIKDILFYVGGVFATILFCIICLICKLYNVKLEDDF